MVRLVINSHGKIDFQMQKKKRKKIMVIIYKQDVLHMLRVCVCVNRQVKSTFFKHLSRRIIRLGFDFYGFPKKMIQTQNSIEQ